MHSSYALASEDFSVERNGASEPLSALWPNGWQPDDRLGVLLANPMDAVGCSNLICGTITLFYDVLTRNPSGFATLLTALEEALTPPATAAAVS